MNNMFTLNSSNGDFSLRQKNVFDQLSLLEKNKEKYEPMEYDDIDKDKREEKYTRNHSHTLKSYRGKESIFKKPNDPVSKNFLKKLPDYKKSPHKWIKYSLEDVKDEHMTDKSNTKAALSFLKELEDRKKEVVNSSLDKDDGQHKIIFRKKVSLKASEATTMEKPSFNSSKIVMPEYVIGQKVKKEKKNRIIKDKDLNNKGLKLDHLLQEEDGNE